MPMNSCSTVNPEKVPEYIRESWKRCQESGNSSSSLDKNSGLSDHEMIEIYDRYAELLHYSSPVMEDLFQTLSGMDLLLLISSPEGYIINSLGNPSFLNDADRVSLRKGANWLEEFKGTNAIGTAIVEKKPLIVHGTQHFYKENHFLTCTAAPIHGPNGELVGVINMSSYHHNFHPYSLGLIKQAAGSIGQALYIHQMKNQKIQSDDLTFAYQYHPASLITINNNGKIIRMNYSAAQTIGSAGPGVIGQPISKVMTEFTPSGFESKTEQKWRYKNQVFTPHLITNGQIILRGEKHEQRSELTNRYHFDDIICQDTELLKTISIAKRIASLEMNLLIQGESGTGKELFAQSIHGASNRKNKPFVAINCSAIPDSLLESELFGYEKGAFTGAKAAGQAGKFEAADGGTLFLDEIGDMPLPAQAALLRVIQERCVTRVGGITPKPIHVRIVAATHKNLLSEIEEGRFRADLYYRLNGFTLQLPALRQRGDLLTLADHILSEITYSTTVPELTEDAKRFILEYSWPGNYRQLHNVLQQAFFLANEQPVTRNLLQTLCPPVQSRVVKNTPVSDSEQASLQEHERTLIKQTLNQCNGNISQAAKQLNIGRNTLYRKIKSYGLIE